MSYSDMGQMVHELVRGYGGYCNAHTHLDRAYTLDPRYLVHYGMTPLEATSAPLRVKQNLVGELHKGPAYKDRFDLEERMRATLQEMRNAGVRSCVSFIDATPDVGLGAIEAAVSVREQCREETTLHIAAHPIFGFKEDSRYPQSRWEVFREACEMADIVGGLPEKDDRPDSIGFNAHIRRILELGIELHKPVHVHVDQDNDPRQEHTLRLIEAVRWMGSPRCSKEGEPTVWAVHCISPSAYNEKKFRKVLDGLRESNIGVICCPRAALSMRQNRAHSGPAHNSIARVLEMVLAGVQVRLGSDNLADMFVPTASSMRHEVAVLVEALRCYIPQVFAKLAAGLALNENDKELVRQHLAQDLKVFREAAPNFQFCLDLG